MKIRLMCFALLFFLVLPGCHQAPPDPNAPYKTAINTYWRVHPGCLFTQPVRMPAEEADNSARSTAYGALTAMGFLQRSAVSKEKFVSGVRSMSTYDLTDKGKPAWVAVPHSHGLGNFCYGHRSVTSIDDVTLAQSTSTAPATATVAYHYAFSDQAPWATDPDLQNAFPTLAASLKAQPDTATLMKTSSGWTMTTPRVATPVAPLAAPAKDPWTANEPQP